MDTNDFLRLRLQNVFSPIKPIPTTPYSSLFQGDLNAPTIPKINTTPSVTVPPDTGFKKYETPDLASYREFLRKQTPQRENNQLNKWGKLLAGVSGVAEGLDRGVSAGVAHGRGLMEAPYKRALENYEMGGGRLKELADIEYKMNTTEQAREVAQREYELKLRKQEVDEFQAQVQAAKSAAEIENLNSLRKTRGITAVQNESTGNYDIVDLNTGTIKNTGIKVKETPGEKTKREAGMFSFQENFRQRGRQALQEDRQSHDYGMEDERQKNRLAIQAQRLIDAKALAKVRSDLDPRTKKELEGIDALNQDRILSLAYTQASIDNPNLPKDSKEFAAKIREHTQNIISKSRYKQSITPGMPTVVDPEDLFEDPDDPEGLF